MPTPPPPGRLSTTAGRLNRRGNLALATLAGLLLAPISSAIGSPHDGAPKILLHRLAVTGKNTCAVGGLADCASAVTAGPLGIPSFVYLLSARGSLESVAAVEVGLDYQAGQPSNINDHSGVDIFSWTKCATIEFPAPGAAAWPRPGGSNLIVWDAVTTCQTSETAVAGYFYVAAYSADELKLITRPASGIATLTTCSAMETSIPATGLGSVRFSSGGTESGCNPCLGPCKDEPPACRATPAAINFGELIVGTSWESRAVTITNDGGGILNGSVSISSPHFTFWGDATYSLAAFQSTTIYAVFKVPQVPGVYAATMSLGEHCPPVALSGSTAYPVVCSVNPRNYDFNWVPIGQTIRQRFMIQNDGLVQLSGSATSGCAAFPIVGDAGYDLAPGESDSIVVAFSPATAGQQSCEIDLGATCTDLRVEGLGGDRPADSCSVTPVVIDFGPVALGQSADRFFYVTNHSPGCLPIQPNFFCPSFDHSQYSQNDACQMNRPVSVAIGFRPSQVGFYECFVSLTGTSCPGVLLRAEGRLPAGGVFTPAIVDFGTIPPGTSSIRIITLSNNGSVAIAGSLSGVCGFFQVLDAPAFSLAPGESREYRIKFHPTEPGAYQCVLDGGTSVNPLQMTGIADPAVPVQPSTWSSIKARFGH